MAHRDLDAALQLLAERAQYITEASGAAIALRRGQHNDMLCRASTGANAPELGALLSMEYGLSGECVRTRQPLRCDDAERDVRVNHEVCRQLGIASVVLMPIVSDEQVLGVFELFSSKARAFEPRDLSALQRLSEMVETAVKYAVATQMPLVLEEPATAEAQPSDNEIVAEGARSEWPVGVTVSEPAPAAPVTVIPLQQVEKPEQEKPEPKKTKPEPALAPKKPLFWSAAMQTHGNAARTEEPAASVAVPPGLRNLQKCQACGFPVSQGRTFCVECEEKQWRGQRLPQPAANAAPAQAPGQSTGASNDPAAIESPAPSLSAVVDSPTPQLASDNSAPFLSSAAPSESWFAANKYILGALIVVAIVIAAIAWLR